jgi:hypothetical protein
MIYIFTGSCGLCLCSQMLVYIPNALINKRDSIRVVGAKCVSLYIWDRFISIDGWMARDEWISQGMEGRVDRWRDR